MKSNKAIAVTNGEIDHTKTRSRKVRKSSREARRRKIAQKSKKSKERRRNHREAMKSKTSTKQGGNARKA